MALLADGTGATGQGVVGCIRSVPLGVSFEGRLKVFFESSGAFCGARGCFFDVLADRTDAAGQKVAGCIRWVPLRGVF